MMVQKRVQVSSLGHPKTNTCVSFSTLVAEQTRWSCTGVFGKAAAGPAAADMGADRQGAAAAAGGDRHRHPLHRRQIVRLQLLPLAKLCMWQAGFTAPATSSCCHRRDQTDDIIQLDYTSRDCMKTDECSSVTLLNMRCRRDQTDDPMGRKVRAEPKEFGDIIRLGGSNCMKTCAKCLPNC